MDKGANYYQVNKLFDDQNSPTESMLSGLDIKNKVRIEVIGEEMIEKTAKLSGKSCRAYLPSLWSGHRVKIIRID